MESSTARWLVSPAAQAYLAHVRQLPDPASLRVATELRRRLTAEQAAAVVTLETLRRQGRRKLGNLSDRLYLTRDGLEQATRWPVAAWRAGRLAAAGAERVIDAGCGLGIDALACAGAGLGVVGVERDEVTAILARANLPGAAILHQAIEQTDFDDWLADPATALFLDPARRTVRGRSWALSDLSPSWETVTALLDRAVGPAAVKLAPGFPYDHLPDRADVTWVSHGRELVETTVWTGPTAAGRRQAVVLAPEQVEPAILDVAGAALPLGPIEAYVFDPDPAVNRARGGGTLAQLLGAHGLADGIAYLSGPAPRRTPLADSFAVIETLPYSEANLRAWTQAHDIGAIEIKLRGLEIDPADLRRKLKLTGKNHTLVILTPTISGAQIIVAERLA